MPNAPADAAISEPLAGLFVTTAAVGGDPPDEVAVAGGAAVCGGVDTPDVERTG